MRRKRLTLEQAALFVFALSTLAWMGVPRFGGYRAPEGAVAGVVLDPSGLRVPGADVALFDDTQRSLVERARTDDHGRFAFTSAPRRYDVFAWREGATDETGAWALGRTRSDGNTVELRLGAGTARQVRVVDPAGGPVQGAEVRVIDARGEAEVLARIATSRSGEATLVLPTRAHVAVLPPEGSDLAPRWLLDLDGADALPETLTLARGHELRGWACDEHGAGLPGALVSAWSLDGSTWLGWALGDRDGSFTLRTPGEGARLRIVDAGRAHLPRSLLVPDGTVADLGAVVLPEGRRLAVQVGTRAAPIPARVWVRGSEDEPWSFGGRTDGAGRIELGAGRRFSAVAIPLEASAQDSPTVLEAHDRVPNGVPLQLTEGSSD